MAEMVRKELPSDVVHRVFEKVITDIRDEVMVMFSAESKKPPKNMVEAQIHLFKMEVDEIKKSLSLKDFKDTNEIEWSLSKRGKEIFDDSISDKDFFIQAVEEISSSYNTLLDEEKERCITYFNELNLADFEDEDAIHDHLKQQHPDVYNWQDWFHRIEIPEVKDHVGDKIAAHFLSTTAMDEADIAEFSLNPDIEKFREIIKKRFKYDTELFYDFKKFIDDTYGENPFKSGTGKLGVSYKLYKKFESYPPPIDFFYHYLDKHYGKLFGRYKNDIQWDVQRKCNDYVDSYKKL